MLASYDEQHAEHETSQNSEDVMETWGQHQGKTDN